MAEYLIQDTTLIELASAVRTKTGNTDMITPGEMVSDLNAIPERAESDLIVNDAIVTVPAGNYKSQATKSVKLSTIATPSISVDSDGKITATVNQTAGYVPDGTITATEQLATQAAKTIIPSKTSQIAVSSGVYTTGDITVAAIPNNYAELNYEVIGGTTPPSNPKENTIWVNTSTAITEYVFSSQTPTAKQGTVWFVTSTSTERPVSFNALKENGIMIYPTSAKQYISGSFTNVEVKAYINGSWVDWILSNLVLYNSGNEYTDITGGWNGVAMSYSMGGGHSVRGKAPTVSKGTSGITIRQGTNKTGGVLRPSNLIDISGYSTLKVTISSYNVESGSGLFLQVRNQSGTVVSESFVNGNGTKTLSINSLSGPHYIDIFLFWYSSGDGAPSATITNVTLTNGG